MGLEKKLVENGWKFVMELGNGSSSGYWGYGSSDGVFFLYGPTERCQVWVLMQEDEMQEADLGSSPTYEQVVEELEALDDYCRYDLPGDRASDAWDRAFSEAVRQDREEEDLGRDGRWF